MQEPHKKILCVDDDLDDNLLIKQSLEKYSTVCIQQAFSGEEALRILRENESNRDLPGLIIMDMNMPVMDGRKTIEAIKTDISLKEIPIIVFTTGMVPKEEDYLISNKIEAIIKPVSWTGYQEVAKKILTYCE
jgi:two-component system response regulator